MAEERRACVAVIDDDPRVCESLESLFDSANIEAKSFSSAETFLEESDLSVLGCVVTDVRMPGMDGYQLYQQLRLKNASLPVLFISAHPNERRQAELLQGKLVGFLCKPFDGEEILEWVSTVLPKR